MRKISVIMPVYNEEFLLPHSLESVSKFVDEIIVIDGSPDGPSIDNTKKIATNYKNVKYLSGTYSTIPGAWDKETQINKGIEAATGDILIFISSDMIFSNIERICDIIRDNDHKIFFCPLIEFWLDINHVRLYGSPGKLSLQSSPLDAFAISKGYQPMAGIYGTVEINTINIKDQMMIGDVYKYHLGWIRPFSEQIQKHIRHVKQGLWGEEGKRLMNSTEKQIEQWAILHVLSYNQIPSIDLDIKLMPAIQELKDMSYLTGQEECIESYQDKYGSSPFRGIKE